MSLSQGHFDVVVIGAGPSGSVVSALLNKKGYRVLVLEKQHFPRFSIGESLLPQCMKFLEQADMLTAVQHAGFQFKNGAAFCCGEDTDFFDFTEKFTEGWGTTFQVQRDQFDKILADEAQAQGVEIHYGQTVTAFNYETGKVTLDVTSDTGDSYQVTAKFALDASGYGRVLPRLLDLDIPSSFASRSSLFTHIEDNIDDAEFDRNKILITVHPLQRDIWYWLIPFNKGRCSVGVVAPPEVLDAMPGTKEEKFAALIAQTANLEKLLASAKFDTRIGNIEGYACDVKQLYGEGFALLGNAGEFLDPVFSSGVTIALKSASLAAEVVDLHLQGKTPDWQLQFEQPLKQGVETFREFVSGWYDGRLQDVIFAKNKNESVKRMISSILAGYAWDANNPYVKDSSRLTTLAELCRS